MPNPASSLATTNLLIGLDDTDNPASGGTGALAQRLLLALDETRLGAALGATRHLLLKDPGIAYTTENISLCLALRASHKRPVSDILETVAGFLKDERADGSNPGLAIAREASWDDPDTAARLVDFGKRAKGEVLDEDAALAVAEAVNVDLSGHGGDNRGVIGALAAVGLHVSGNDGFFVWMPDVRELGGPVTYRQLRMLAPAVDVALDATGREPADEDVIDLGSWVRPILLQGLAVLLLDPPTVTTGQAGGFGARPKEITRWAVSPPEVVRQR